jgi:AraC-like DNA-binding protein
MGVVCRGPTVTGEIELRYAVLLSPQALARVHTALAGHGTVDVLLDVRELLVELASPRDECIVLDPALVTPVNAESIAANLAEFPRAVIAFSSVSTAALESSVIFAQRTPARFVFRGTPNERSALERALLLIPDSMLGRTLLSMIDENMTRLPVSLRDRIMAMLQNGDGPYTPNALAASSALSRRSLDRYLAEAGFVSSRRLIESARVISAYRTITTSRTPLVHIAAMLGYKSQRTLDAQLAILLDTTSSKLRTTPLSIADAAQCLAFRLTTRESPQVRKPARPRRISSDGVPSLKLVGSDSHTKRPRRTASGER